MNQLCSIPSAECTSIVIVWLWFTTRVGPGFVMPVVVFCSPHPRMPSPYNSNVGGDWITMTVGPWFDWDALENPQPVDMPPYSVKLFVSARAGTTAIADATNANVRVATQRAFPDRFIVHASGVARRLPRINVFRNYHDG